MELAGRGSDGGEREDGKDAVVQKRLISAAAGSAGR